MNNLIPVNDRVVVKLEPYKASSSIHYPETSQSFCPNMGVVKFVGAKAKEVGLNIGDKVAVEMFTGSPFIDFNGEELKILRVEHILGIIEPSNEIPV